MGSEDQENPTRGWHFSVTWLDTEGSQWVEMEMDGHLGLGEEHLYSFPRAAINKVPQTKQWTQQKWVVSQFWSLEV